MIIANATSATDEAATMRNEQCSLCFGVLEVRELAPCEDCGGDPQQIEHFRVGKHTHQRFEVLADLELTFRRDLKSMAPSFSRVARPSSLWSISK
jgi:hypothetical protein